MYFQTLFVSRLLLKTTEAKVKNVFECIIHNQNGDNSADILGVKKIKTYAFIHFRSKEVAELALEQVIMI